MANKLSEETGEGTSQSHNVEHRTKQISDALGELYLADQRIQASLAKHVEPDREVKRDIKAKLREDLNLPTKLLNARYNAYRIQRQAAEAQDESSMDLLRELFEITAPGEQVSMMSALDDGTQPVGTA